MLGGFILALVLAGLAYVGVGAVQLWRAPTRPGPGQLAPPLMGTTLDGEHFDLAALQGRVALLDFRASWCRGCITWIPIAQRLHHGLGPGGWWSWGSASSTTRPACAAWWPSEASCIHT
jgi:hypothetical protein